MYEGGIKEYDAYINKNKTPIHDEIIYVEDMQNDIKIEVSMQYNDGYQENIYSFCNNINTHEPAAPYLMTFCFFFKDLLRPSIDLFLSSIMFP